MRSVSSLAAPIRIWFRPPYWKPARHQAALKEQIAGLHLNNKWIQNQKDVLEKQQKMLQVWRIAVNEQLLNRTFHLPSRLEVGPSHSDRRIFTTTCYNKVTKSFWPVYLRQTRVFAHILILSNPRNTLPVTYSFEPTFVLRAQKKWLIIGESKKMVVLGSRDHIKGEGGGWSWLNQKNFVRKKTHTKKKY